MNALSADNAILTLPALMLTSDLSQINICSRFSSLNGSDSNGCNIPAFLRVLASCVNPA
jgi:hypothetical protein